jgi:arabinogalactan oligomer/maltooligosaccharide transport system substrate-binding protein
MKITHKGAGVTALVVSAGLLLSACSSTTEEGASAEPSDTTPASTLTVWVDAERTAEVQAAADSYESATGIDVEVVSRDNSTLKDDFIQQANSGSGPDVVMGAHDWLGELVTNGVVAPIELGDKSGDFLDVALEASTYDGVVYELPFGVENLAMLRNVDLVPEPVDTFDEMIAAGQAAGVEFPFVVEQGENGNPYHLYPFQTAFGAPVFGRDANGSYDPTQLTLGDGTDFAIWLGQQGAAGTMSTEITGDIAKEKFTAGEAAFWLTGPWNVPSAREAGINFAVDVIPSPGPDAAQPFAGVKGFFVNEYSENKLAANDFLVNYVATTEVQVALFNNGGVLPALRSAAEEVASDPVVGGFLAAGEQAVAMPAIPQMGRVWEYWGIAEAAILNGADPEATWAQLTADVEAAINS